MEKNLASNKPDSERVQIDANLAEDNSRQAENDGENPHTYSQILKSSAIIGGSSIINIGIGIIRTKAMALILGPAGFGIMGLYSSIIDLTQSVAGMGVSSSGVRQIAEAAGSGDTGKIATTTSVLRRTSLFLALMGAVFLFGLSKQVSALTFGSDQYSTGVALLSLAVFFNLLSASQSALLQGLRRITDLAKISILGALFGTLISIPTVYFLHEDGIVPSLILIAALTLLTSWFYRRKINLPDLPVSRSLLRLEQSALLKLGFAFMFSGLMMTASAYVVRIIIVRNVNFDAAGLYQSAWTLGGLYVGFILQAMGTDFYPRLTAIANNNTECNRIVNEQAHVSLLLAGPGVIATLTFAPVVIALFYTSKFYGAIETLRWLCLGMTLRVVSWPLGFIIVAKGAKNIIILSELAWATVYLGFAMVCVKLMGLNGAGIAFFLSYIFHVLMVYVIVRRLSQFRWSRANTQIISLYTALIGIVFYSFYTLPALAAIGIGILATVLSMIYSLRVILVLVSIDNAPRIVVSLIRLLRPLLPKNTPSSLQTTKTARNPLLKSNLFRIIYYLIWLLIICAAGYAVNHEFAGINFWLNNWAELKQRLLENLFSRE